MADGTLLVPLDEFQRVAHCGVSLVQEQRNFPPFQYTCTSQTSTELNGQKDDPYSNAAHLSSIGNCFLLVRSPN